MRDAAAQERVGEQAHAVQLDQNGAVADPGDALRAQETSIEAALLRADLILTG
jgi:hypothetical protein